MYAYIFKKIFHYSITELPIIVKGILNPADAKIAADLGCSGVFVSNHGGRQLDTAPATVCHTCLSLKYSLLTYSKLINFRLKLCPA